MLKWQGDFTLPRLRSKLANKYLMHPDVEPDYVEVYRPDLGQTTILRKDSFSSFGNQSTAYGLGDTTRSLSRTTSRGFGSNASLDDRRRAQLTMQRVSSVPTLGTRNLARAPASLQPLPPSLQGSASATTLRAGVDATTAAAPLQVPTSPSAGGDDRRAQEKEQMAALASRRMWTFSSGVEYNMKFELARLADEDPKPSNTAVLQCLSKVPLPYMTDLFKQGGKIDWRNKDWDGGTLLLKAVRADSRPLAMYCLGMQADPMVLDDSGRGVLHWAAVQGNPEVTDYFLTHYPDLQVSAPDNGGDTPLHLSAYFGHLPIARLLIRADADPMLTNAGGFTPMELAETRRAWHVSAYLRENRQHEEDRSTRDSTQMKDLRRPCDLAQAAKVRAAEMQNPTKKPAKAPPKK